MDGRNQRRFTYAGEKDEIRPNTQLTTNTQFGIEHDIVHAAVDQGFQSRSRVGQNLTGTAQAE